MFLLFTPYSFLFFTIYLGFMCSLLSISNFYYYWFVIELIMLLFVGVGYTLFVSSYSQFIMYFLIQTAASFLILLFYVLESPSLLTLSLLLKLSMFPFHFWYINLIYRFPNFMFWLASTLHNVPALLIISLFCLRLDQNILWGSMVLTTLVASTVMLALTDFRMLLVLSSIGNNSWFLLSQIASVWGFFLFTIVYSISFFFVINELTGPLVPLSPSFSPYSLLVWVVSLSGMPPFPIFYVKMLIVFLLLGSYGLNYYFTTFLLFNALMIIGYIQSLINWFVYAYAASFSYIFKF